MTTPSLPVRCPACDGRLSVTRLRCESCDTEVQGSFRSCLVCTLDGEAQRLFDLFLQARGNLKDVQRALGVSYPTVRQRIEALFQKLGLGPSPPERMSVLAQLSRGEITVAEAERVLRGED